VKMDKALQRGLRLAFALLAGFAVASCGGGDGTVGSGGTGRSAGYAAGTVNGFGSVIVDGVPFDNRDAPSVFEVAPGQDALTEVKLGQRVSVSYETAGVATVVRVDPALVGVVSDVVSSGQFTVYGQTVVINSGAATGPVTQFGGGYGQAADVLAGDAIEVHGVLVKQSDSYRIQATRVDKLSSLPNYVRVMGVLSTVGNGASTLSIGALNIDAAGSAVIPPDRTPAVGQTVSVLALASTLTMPGPGIWHVRAAQVRIRQLKASDNDLDDYVSGAISDLNSQTKTFSLGSQPVSYASAAIAPPLALANGQYVRVRGAIDMSATLVATSIDIRDDGVANESELRGNVAGFDAATQRFTVRDVVVDASNATLEGCPASGLADGLYVEVAGALGSTAVLAHSVHCEDEPSGATIEREGVVAAVDLAAATLSLVPEHGLSVSVQWTAGTYFGGVTPQTLLGKKVSVEGTLSGSMLIAKKIKLGD